MITVIAFVVCLATAPDRCERFELATDMNLLTCRGIGGQVEIAQWLARQPAEWRLLRWTCERGLRA